MFSIPTLLLSATLSAPAQAATAAEYCPPSSRWMCELIEWIAEETGPNIPTELRVSELGELSFGAATVEATAGELWSAISDFQEAARAAGDAAPTVASYTPTGDGEATVVLAAEDGSSGSLVIHLTIEGNTQGLVWTTAW